MNTPIQKDLALFLISEAIESKNNDKFIIAMINRVRASIEDLEALHEAIANDSEELASYRLDLYGNWYFETVLYREDK